MADKEESESEEEFIPKQTTTWEYNENHPNSKEVIEKARTQIENQMDTLFDDFEKTQVSFPESSETVAEDELPDDVIDTAVNAIATQLENLALLLNKARDNIDRKTNEKISNAHDVEIISESPLEGNLELNYIANFTRKSARYIERVCQSIMVRKHSF